MYGQYAHRFTGGAAPVQVHKGGAGQVYHGGHQVGRLAGHGKGHEAAAGVPDEPDAAGIDTVGGGSLPDQVLEVGDIADLVGLLRRRVAAGRRGAPLPAPVCGDQAIGVNHHELLAVYPVEQAHVKGLYLAIGAAAVQYHDQGIAGAVVVIGRYLHHGGALPAQYQRGV